MATRRWGLSRGETHLQVTEAVGAATVSDNLEVTLDLAAGMDRSEVLMLLDYIKGRIVSGIWPPA